MSWQNDLNKSANDFLNIVWPKIKIHCREGILTPIELMHDNEIARSLDMNAGIDAWQEISGIGVRGIASRIQYGETAWNTFTIRLKRDSGAQTEYEKRKYAIETGAFIYPYLTCHAYINHAELLSCGLARTKDIFEAINDNSIIRRTENASFYVVKFADVKFCKVIKP